MGGGVCGGDVDCQRYSMDAPPPRPTAAAWQDIFRRPVRPPSALSGGRAATGSATFRWLPWPVHSRLYSCHHGRGPGGNGICLLAPEGPRGFAPGCRAVIRNSRPLAGLTISYQKCFSRRILFSRGKPLVEKLHCVRTFQSRNRSDHGALAGGRPRPAAAPTAHAGNRATSTRAYLSGRACPLQLSA